MKKFRFSLQSVRSLRDQKEKEAQQKYLEALKKFEETVRRYQQAKKEYNDCVESFKKDMIAGVNSDRLAKFWEYSQVLDAHQKQVEKIMHTEEKHVQNAWKEMVLASRDREALDRFYQKQRRIFNQLNDKEEQKSMDELAARMAGIASSWR